MSFNGGGADYANRARDRSFAFIASISRLRGRARVASDANNRRATLTHHSTARSNAASLACEGSVKPLSLRNELQREHESRPRLRRLEIEQSADVAAQFETGSVIFTSYVAKARLMPAAIEDEP